MIRSRGKPSQEIDSEPERTLRKRLKENQNQSTPKDHFAMENIEGTLDEQALRPRRTMEDFVTQSPNANRTSIITPTIQANNFDFKPQLLLMLQTHYQFSGLANEDPNDHFERFLDLCATFKYNAGSIATWEDLQKKFFGKYFPSAKTIKLRNEIFQFLQELEEHLSEAWERFNGLLKKCPNHKIELWSQIEIFYNGLNINTRSMIDSAAGGSISKKTPEEVHELIEEMTTNMYQYPMERSSKKADGIYKLDSSTATQAQLEALRQQFANFQQQSNPVVAQFAEYVEEDMLIMNAKDGSISNTYNPGWKNHPNFSWNNANQARQHPPGLKPIPTNTQQKEELVATKAELEEEKKLNQAMYTELQSLRQTVTLLTTQMNHLNQGAYERLRGALPSNSEINPKEQVKAITLRSGKTLEELQPKEQPAMEEEKTQKGEEEKENEKVSPPSFPRRKKGKDALPITDIDIRHLPYPSRAKFDILESSFARFLETFQKLQINIPLLEALRQIPLYGKFLKEVLSGKRKIEEKGPVVLNENCSAILKNELPTKLKDPGSFTIPCEIGSNKFANALCDLAASVNLMSLSLCRYLKLGEPQETGITLQFADRSTKIPEGVMEDVLVKIQDFIYPCDFIVLDMKVDKNLPIILGRPFLATAGAIIDCKQGNLTLRLNNDTISFNIKEAMKQPAIPHDDFCLSIDVIDYCIAEIEEEERTEVEEEEGLIHSENENPIISREFGELEAESEELEEQRAPEAPKPELKSLSSNLKYVFLEKNDKTVIISSCLTGLEEKMLIEVLSKHKKAIGWSLPDIEGINPTICTHRILMEDNYKPNIKPQRRLNPTLQEVVKKEVIKLLDAGIIYPISDSAWVSPVQVVPKKGGTIVILNENNELIPTRIVTGWRVCIDYRKLNAATRKDHFPLPFIDQMLERLAGNKFYCFLDGYSGYFQIPIAPEDQEKTTFTCLYGTFAYRRMPFGLCNAPTTFQRCMMALFHDMIEKMMEIFMDSFTIYGLTFETCLQHLELVLKRCEEKNLVLNWEKCHFMVREGIVLGHKISEKGIEVDKAKIEVIKKLPPPTSVKGIRSFLGHVGFYKRFIKDFSKVAKPLSNLLLKDVKFDFNNECLHAFNLLKQKLISAPIIVSPDWNLPFKLMCDASDFALGAALGQRKEKVFHTISYASHTLTGPQLNYTTTEKELMAVVFAFEKFRSYLIGSKVIVWTDHAALRYLFAKKDSKPRLIRWILLLQEFDIEIKDKKCAENVVADHLSRLEAKNKDGEVSELFLDEMICQVSTSKVPWYADIANFVCSKWVPKHFTYQQRKKLMADSKHYYWEDPFL
ncbi:hypothetical protein H6P81_003347 [Aristolochia fimbriata]|uniref:RNA-directed DNA polymerase n=1 Tax=Aristolochia fimbriata TaxID=158543 RepID=A0AAV7FE16_ARIFI|nr:hypothetical protein H6P81_003347 [Aristolochia fimbriata]